MGAAKTKDWASEMAVSQQLEIKLAIVRQQILSRKAFLSRMMQLLPTDDKLLSEICDKIQEEKRSFRSPDEASAYYADVTRTVAWQHANANEADYIIGHLKSGDQKFASEFFYGNSANRCNVSRIRAKIAATIWQTYGYKISNLEFGNILYTHLWSDGSWKPLDTFAHQSSFFCWLEPVARHAVIAELEELGLINVCHERTPGNTRLLGTSVASEVWDLIIAYLMPKGLAQDLLIASFVRKDTEAEMATAFGLEAADLHKHLVQAQKQLKEMLIRENNYLSDLVLRDKKQRRLEVSDNFVQEFAQWQAGESSANPLSDVLGVNLEPDVLHDKVIDFLYRFPISLGWNDEDRLVWQLRVIEEMPPVEAASRCGRSRAWLDTRLSRLWVRFKAAARLWWRRNL